MKIDQAMAALKRGETVNCPDTGRTYTSETREGERYVHGVRKGEDGEPDDTNVMTIDRFEGLHKRFVFGEGEFKLGRQGSTKAKATPNPAD